MREEFCGGEGGALFSHLVPERYFFSLVFPRCFGFFTAFLLCLTLSSLPHLGWFLSSYCFCGPSNSVAEFLSPFTHAFLDLPTAGSGNLSCSEHLLPVQAGCRTALFGASFTALVELMMCLD